MHRRMNANPARIDRDDERRMLPCRFFIQGYCHREHKCKFYHPNMHVRDPCVKVPELPANFRIPQYGQYEQTSNVPSLLEMTSRGARSRKVRSGLSSPIGLGGVSPALSTRSRVDGFAKNVLTPSSYAYSEFMACAKEQDELLEDFEDSPSEELKLQNTVFNHIDWSEFLAPGVNPPPPTLVPEQGVAMSPVREFDGTVNWIGGQRVHERTTSSRAWPTGRMQNEDMPPEGSQVAGHSSGDHQSSSGSGSPTKLSAKEELQLKVKAIAKSLKDEPIQHVRSLDSFFRNYNYKLNGPVTASGPHLAPTEEDDTETDITDDKTHLANWIKETSSQEIIQDLMEEGNGSQLVESIATITPVQE